MFKRLDLSSPAFYCNSKIIKTNLNILFHQNHIQYLKLFILTCPHMQLNWNWHLPLGEKKSNWWNFIFWCGTVPSKVFCRENMKPWLEMFSKILLIAAEDGLENYVCLRLVTTPAARSSCRWIQDCRYCGGILYVFRQGSSAFQKLLICCLLLV